MHVINANYWEGKLLITGTDNSYKFIEQTNNGISSTRNDEANKREEDQVIMYVCCVNTIMTERFTVTPWSTESISMPKM